mgnify:CR=1 FL=1
MKALEAWARGLPLIADGRAEGVVEIFQRADSQPNAQRGYQRFLDSGGWHQEAEMAPSNRPHEDAGPVKRTRKQSRRERSEILTRRSKALRPLEKDMAEIEGVIETCEQRLQSLHTDMQRATARRDASPSAAGSRAPAAAS